MLILINLNVSGLIVLISVKVWLGGLKQFGSNLMPFQMRSAIFFRALKNMNNARPFMSTGTMKFSFALLVVLIASISIAKGTIPSIRGSHSLSHVTLFMLV